MYGFLYRDLRIMKTLLVIVLVTCLPMLIFMPIMGALNWSIEELSDSMEYNLPCMIGYAMIMFFAYIFQSELHKTDEKCLPIYFAVSSPAGVNGYVKSKYISCFIIGFAALNICLITDSIACSILEHRTELIPTSFQGLYTGFFMLTLFLNAIEIPFIVRFGYKKGVNLKAGLFVLLIVAVGIYFLFGDISMFGSMEDFMQFLIDVLNGTRGGTTLVAVSALTPIAVGVLYCLSYKLSCKLYLKGVEQLEQ